MNCWQVGVGGCLQALLLSKLLHRRKYSQEEFPFPHSLAFIDKLYEIDWMNCGWDVRIGFECMNWKFVILKGLLNGISRRWQHFYMEMDCAMFDSVVI